MSGGLAQIITEDLRLCILRVLAEDRDNQVNSAIIGRAVERFGFRETRERIHTELTWLADQGAVTNEEVGTVLVATLTERGRNHLERRETIAGVTRPGLR